MLDIADIKAVFLDHSYCKKIVIEAQIPSNSSTTEEQRIMANNTLNWDEIDVEFKPPSPYTDVPLSALSPAHSMDSGFGNEMNFLAELDRMDFDSVMDLLNADASTNNEKQETVQPDTAKQPKQPAHSVKVASVTAKASDEMNEIEKGRKNAIAARENRLKKKKYVEGMEQELEQLQKENEVLKAKDRRYSQVVGQLRNEVSYLKNVIANQSTLSTLVERLVTTPGLNFTTNFTDERPTKDKSDADDVTIDDDDDEHVTETPLETETPPLETETPPLETETPPLETETPPLETQSCKEKVRKFIQTRSQTRDTKRSAPAESSSTGRKKARRDDVKGGVCLHVSQDKVSLAFCSQCSINANGSTQH